MDQQWFYQADQKECGPVSIQTLQRWVQEGHLDTESLVKQGQGEWVPAKEIKGLVWPMEKKYTQHMLAAHFHPLSMDDLSVSERKFPFRVRADLQRAIDRLFIEGTAVSYFCGIQHDYPSDYSFSTLLTNGRNPCVAVPPEYEEVDIGEEKHIRCLKNGLWLLEREGQKYAVLLTPAGHYHQITGIQFQIATPKNQEGAFFLEKLFKHLEESVLKSESYRGKVLSLEMAEHSYSGESTGITVHRLRTVTQEQVILPKKTLDLLERNVIRFVEQREKLAKYGQPTKKGLLFYGPPGTGKTHTLHYLAGKLKGHTTLLISAEQVGRLAEYMTLARLLQPSIVVLEDADLIARERTQMASPCEEVLLNKLLNEMDGLKEQADILFILTTNRPESLESALTSRPGRIDQAIEFPLPDEEGREKLIRLYSQGVELSQDMIAAIVKRTEGVSPAFIKELMRRSLQFHLERDGLGQLDLPDVENALEEMVFSGGSLNLKLLGAENIKQCGN